MTIPTSLFDPAASSIDAVRAAIEGLVIEKRAFIDGEFGGGNGCIPGKVSPVDGQPINVTACEQPEIERAVTAARRSFESGMWVNADRKRILLALADAMEEHRGELALIDCFETGRALQNYYNDSIPKAVDALRWFANAAERLKDEVIPSDANTRATITREPLGVVGLITPWNDPMVVSMWKLGAALMMGNSVVLKPSENSSLSILKVAALARQAGIPAGVLNVVPGLGDIAGKALALHMDVDGIFFTGSSVTGKLVMQYAGQSNMKRVELECGGKSAFMVSRHCRRLEEAAETLARNIFYNQGQICSAPSRLIIEASVKEAFLPHLLAAAGHYVPGHPYDMRSRVGCVVNQKQKSRVDGYIARGMASAQLISKLHQPVHPLAVAPVIFDAVDPRNVIAQEEIFGPVLSVIAAADLEEAIAVANNTRYGLAAAIWSDDLEEAQQVARRLRAGIVHVNSYGADTMEAPFGGIKESGIGKDKSLYAFDGYSILKTNWLQLRAS